MGIIMQSLPTVKIERDGESVTINESDFDAKSMKLFGEKPAAKPMVKKVSKSKSES